MVIETSVVVGILLREAGYEPHLLRLLTAEQSSMSAVNYMEAGIVIASRKGEDAVVEVDRILAHARVAIIPVSVTQAQIAREAYVRFGKGFHKARLNLADCFAYALAKQLNEPLYFKGNDFEQTDLLKLRWI